MLPDKKVTFQALGARPFPASPRSAVPPVYRPGVAPRVRTALAITPPAGRGLPSPASLQCRFAPAPRFSHVVQAKHTITLPRVYTNLNPSAATPVEPREIFRLEDFFGNYRMHRGSERAAYVPNSKYIFVRTMGGEMLMHPRFRHPALAQGRPVLYAGEASFNNGQLEWWSNGSGNYRPDSKHAEQAQLPMERFYTFEQILKGIHKQPANTLRRLGGGVLSTQPFLPWPRHERSRRRTEHDVVLRKPMTKNSSPPISKPVHSMSVRATAPAPPGLIGPPVYRPQTPISPPLQPKMGTPARPAMAQNLPPPVYRPQPLPILQRSAVRSGPLLRAARSSAKTPSPPTPLLQGGEGRGTRSSPLGVPMAAPPHSRPPAKYVVQRYTVVPLADQGRGNWAGVGAPLRVSDDGNMAVKHTVATPEGTNAYQVLYATRPLIAQIQANLARVNSAFQAAEGGTTLRGPAPNGTGMRTLYEVVVTNTELAAGCTFESCNANMWHYMGVYRNRAFPRTPYTRFASPVGGRTEYASRDDTAPGVKAAREAITGVRGADEGRRIYQGMWGWTRNWYAWWYGINQYAAPGMAEGIGIFRMDTRGAGQAHFAAVVAKSGDDTVMIENYAGNPGSLAAIGGLPARPNPNWYFRMFGPVKKYWFSTDDQTFYGDHLRLGEYGPSPMVVHFTAR